VQRLPTFALGLAVGLVLADSSVVILALPEILDQFNVAIDDVAWVLTLFNLVLALAAVPAAYLARSRAPDLVCRAGLVVFAAASLGCALAPSFEVLLACRALQGLCMPGLLTVGAPYVVPRSAARCTASTIAGWAWPRIDAP